MIDSASLIPSSVNPYPKPASGETPGTARSSSSSSQADKSAKGPYECRGGIRIRIGTVRTGAIHPLHPLPSRKTFDPFKKYFNFSSKEAFCAAAAPALSPPLAENTTRVHNGSTVSYCMIAQEIDAAPAPAAAAPAV